MNNLSGRLVIYLVGGAAIFVILFGIRGSASIINPILLAAVITITVLPVPSRLTKRTVPGWLALVLTILMVVLLLGLIILTVFFSITRLAVELSVYLADSSQQAATASGSETSDSTTQITI
jgi:predicted PurR-regulated permease PerM